MKDVLCVVWYDNFKRDYSRIFPLLWLCSGASCFGNSRKLTPSIFLFLLSPPFYSFLLPLASSFYSSSDDPIAPCHNRNRYPSLLAHEPNYPSITPELPQQLSIQQQFTGGLCACSERRSSARPWHHEFGHSMPKRFTIIAFFSPLLDFSSLLFSCFFPLSIPCITIHV